MIRRNPTRSRGMEAAELTPDGALFMLVYLGGGVDDESWAKALTRAREFEAVTRERLAGESPEPA